MKLEDLTSGLQITGVVPHEAVHVIYAQRHGADAVELTYKTSSGDLNQRVLFRRDESALAISTTGSRSFDASATDFKVVAEAQRIRLAGLYDPMLAVATSDIQPLPHQIRAVYGELLPRTPLRFLLADDPGAGKTIMAGLFIKELILRDDVQRCLIVAPGGLVEQWQDELFFKFGLRFDILTTQMIDANINFNAFEEHALLIARMDQVARNETLLTQLRDSHWDLVIVDEAHRMGAHYFGGKVEKTKRFQLGELLGDIARHFLIMTATPHSGKEADFQLFLSLLDKDRFAGRNLTAVDTADIMRRMVKEDLLTFDGRKLFPERVAESIPYELTALENDLYEQVTDYVRNGMNRAESIGGKRGNTVGFALTVLQRRLASSPEAILRSLERRADRLEAVKLGMENANANDSRQPWDAAFDNANLALIDEDEYPADDLEEFEENVVDAATTAETIADLQAEILELRQLAHVAANVRDRGDDRKWSELSLILQDNVIPRDAAGKPRKIIIFTEHRDTLNYLTARIRTLLGRPNAVAAIHGGVRRAERRAITEEFTKNPECQILLATDAAGEGLNLQAAHLMVNYDLPWNPNRIEQRFGRIHRIGQDQVCRLWNLVAVNTREGEVFTALLTKVEEQRKAYGGKVFDVLGSVFSEMPLRDLLIAAIRYGELPETRARMHQVIDKSVAEGLEELIHERALASEHLSSTDLARLRAEMDEARARRLQPHYIELTFREAFARFGGKLVRREKGRYEISAVPASLRNGKYGPIATRYERVTFSFESVRPDGLVAADLLAPGHPLHDAVMDQAVTTLAGVLNRGTILVSSATTEPMLLVGVVEEVVDSTGASVARRFGYAFADAAGTVTQAGPAPYLDCQPAPDTPAVRSLKSSAWLHDAEQRAVSWIIENELPEYLNQVQPRRAAELAKQRELVRARLAQESERLTVEAQIAHEKESIGERPKESSESLQRKAQELRVRLDRRLQLIDQQSSMSTKPPQVVAAALILPAALLEADLPDDAPFHSQPDMESMREAVHAVLSHERALGRDPVPVATGSIGYDILSADAATGDTYRICVKRQSEDSERVWVTHNEVVTSKNATPKYRLALVAAVHVGGEVRYLASPFANTDLGSFEATGQWVEWARLWQASTTPF